MLTMTCDRCGETIEFDDQKAKEQGRDRWRFAGRDIIVDLCSLCSPVVRQQWLDEIESWANPKPLEVRSQ